MFRRYQTPRPPIVSLPKNCQGRVAAEVKPFILNKDGSKLDVGVWFGCIGLSSTDMRLIKAETEIPRNRLDDERLRQIGDVASTAIALLCDTCPWKTPDEDNHEPLPEYEQPENVVHLRKASGER